MKTARLLLPAFLLLFCLSGQGVKAQPAGSDTPTAYLVADAHLDTQWNWDIQATIKDYVRNTLFLNNKLIEKYPDYIFNFEGGVKYNFMKEYFPHEYEVLKKNIAAGRWHISGASWEASDIIVPSIESSIRNIMLGQTFYRTEFGVESTDIFLPDCFGFGWTVPTIASHCGLIGFSSQKLAWRVNPFYSGNRRYPFNLGLWQGVDGSRIMMAHGYNYTTHWGDEDLTQNSRLADAAKENSLGVFLHYYGTGDIGGSPTITSVEAVEKALGKTDGKVKVVSAASDDIFKHFMPFSSHPELPVFDGELTMDVHGTGCYTSQAAMKLYNRQNELLGDAAERAALAAEMTGMARYPSASLTESWRRFIFHQFHDDLTGTSIPRAYEFSWNDELLSLKQFAGILEYSVGAVASQLDTRVKGTPVVLYNALGFDVTDVAEIIIPCKAMPAKVSVSDSNGKAAKAQVVGFDNGKARILVEASVPANGYAVYDVKLSGTSTAKRHVKTNTLENSLYRLTLDENGDISSLVMKEQGKELVKEGRAIRLAVFTENESYSWPAWEVLKKTLDKEPVSITGNVSVYSVEQGALRSTLCVEKEYGDSKFRQYIRLYEGALAERIDFYNEVEWASTNTLLKAEFPLAIENENATYDLGVGTIERGNNTPTAYEVYSQRWADLSDRSGDYGLTVMNDCKYGWDKPDNNTLRLTLLHTPATDRAYTYQNRQDYGYHTFTYSIVPHTGKLDKAAASFKADKLNQRLKAFITAKHTGSLGRSFSLAKCDNPAVAIKALKKADCSDEYVVRVYETAGTAPQNAVITFPYAIKTAAVADGTEKTLSPAQFNGNTLNVAVGKNGIATYKLTFDCKTVNESMAGTTLPLNFDKKCFSWNGFEAEADFSEGYSYAAELIPAEIISGGVRFEPETKGLFNGKVCRGDTIQLPDGNYNRLYILAAAASETSAAEGTFVAGKEATTLTVPSYTGFIGQWGHTGHTTGYLLADDVAYTGTHRHSPNGDEAYEFTYMFKYAIDLPRGAKEIVLPDNPSIILFAATLVNDTAPAFDTATELFRTSIHETAAMTSGKEETEARTSLIGAENIVKWSGYVNNSERPELMHDGNTTTKWCDGTSIPSYVEYDLGEAKEMTGWSMVNAGIEQAAYITATCLVQARNSETEDWKTIDKLIGNKRNVINRTFAQPIEARYLRLLVVQPTQNADGVATRIYEFSVY